MRRCPPDAPPDYALRRHLVHKTRSAGTKSCCLPGATYNTTPALILHRRLTRETRRSVPKCRCQPDAPPALTLRRRLVRLTRSAALMHNTFQTLCRLWQHENAAAQLPRYK